MRECRAVHTIHAKQTCMLISVFRTLCHIVALCMVGVPSDRCQKESMIREIYSSADKRRINKRLCGYGAARFYHPQGITQCAFTNTIGSHNTHLMSSFLQHAKHSWEVAVVYRYSRCGASVRCWWIPLFLVLERAVEPAGPPKPLQA